MLPYSKNHCLWTKAAKEEMSIRRTENSRMCDVLINNYLKCKRIKISNENTEIGRMDFKSIRPTLSTTYSFQTQRRRLGVKDGDRWPLPTVITRAGCWGGHVNIRKTRLSKKW